MVPPMVDFAALFDASPNPYMVLDRDLRYVAVNQAYLDVTARTREELIGARVTDLFPHDPDDPDNANRRLLVDSFERVLATGERDVLPYIHYRIPVGGVHEDRYWSATHTPILDEAGRVALILQHTLHYEPADIRRVLGCLPRAWVLGDETNGLADGGQKLDSQALAAQLVASDLIDQLFVGIFVVADQLHQRRRLARIAWILPSASA